MTALYRKYFIHLFFKHLLGVFYMPHPVLHTEDTGIMKSQYLPKLRLPQVRPSHLLVTKKCTVPLPMLCPLDPARKMLTVLLRSDFRDPLLVA